MSNDTLTPPPAPVAPGPTPPPASSSTAKVIATLLVVLGALVIAFSAADGVWSALGSGLRQSQVQAVSASGVTSLDVDVSRTELTVVFADVDEATLDVTDSGRGEWRFERDGHRLRVASPHLGWFGWLGAGRSGSAVLTLPASLAGLDATMSLAAGSLDANGSFGALRVELAAGSLTVTGQARSLDATVSAGSADLSLADVDEARLSLAAGDLVGRLTGSAPSRTSVEVSAGSLDLTLPDVAYALRSEVSAGSLDHSSLTTSSAAPRTVSAQVSAGSVILRGRG